MKTRFLNRICLLISLMIMMVVSCKKGPSYLGTIQINTDKEVYQVNDPIIVDVNNLTDSVAVHSWNDLHNFVPITYKYENELWSGYLVDYRIENNHCCKELLPGSKVRDTLHIYFEKGIYRIQYYFTMRPGNRYTSFYSNIFKVQ